MREAFGGAFMIKLMLIFLYSNFYAIKTAGILKFFNTILFTTCYR